VTVGLEEELYLIAGSKIELVPQLFGDRNLAFAGERGFHKFLTFLKK
jgi:hypothetical protein